MREIPFNEPEIAISATEQTGLIPALPEDDAECESYEELYPLHNQKPPQKAPE